MRVFDLFAEWMVLCEASISSVVPHLRGTLNIPGGLGETERVLAVSETRCWPRLIVCWRRLFGLRLGSQQLTCRIALCLTDMSTPERAFIE